MRDHPDPSPPPESPAWRQDRRLYVVALAAILLLAAALRIYRLDEKSFWLDEFQSVAMAVGRGYAHMDLPVNVLLPAPPKLIDLATGVPTWRMWFGEPQGHMPPLYPLLLRYWAELFGLGQLSARAFSVTTSVAAVGMLFLVVRELSGASAALWAALLMAVAGPQIGYAQETRNYALLTFEALGAAAALVRIERRGPTLPRCAALSACVAAMALTHYFSIGTLVTLSVYAGLRLRGGPKLRAAAVSFAAAGLAWVLLFGRVALGHTQNLDKPAWSAFLADGSPGHAARTLWRLAAVPVRFFTEPMTNSLNAAAAGGVAFVLAALAPVRRRDLLLWGLWLPLTVLPVLLLDLLRETKHLEFIRYTLLAAPAVYALIAAALAHARGWARHLPPALAVVACLLALPNAYEAWQKANWRGLAEAVNGAERPGDVTVYWAGDYYPEYPNQAFLHTSYYRSTPPGPVVLLREPPDDALLRQLREAPGVLVVSLSGTVQDAVPGAELQWLAFEPGAGRAWRATWKETPPSTARTSAAAH